MILMMTTTATKKTMTTMTTTMTSGVFPAPWLTTAASDGWRLNSAAAVDAVDVPGADHADETSRLRSASVS